MLLHGGSRDFPYGRLGGSRWATASRIQKPYKGMKTRSMGIKIIGENPPLRELLHRAVMARREGGREGQFELPSRCFTVSLLRSGLLQPRWVETRGGWEEGKINAPRAPVFSLFSFTGVY